MDESHPETKSPLLEMAVLFLKLGTIAFGGPAAHIAMMDAEVVGRLKWISREEFIDLLGAVNLIPGPNSTELAIHIGYRRAGWKGLLVAGACFILPAALIVGLIASLYVRFGKLPQAEGLLFGIKPVIVAVVLQALWGLGRTAIKTWYLALIGLADMALGFRGVHELILLFGTALVLAAGQAATRGKHEKAGAGSLPLMPGAANLPLAGVLGAAAIPFSLTKMFLVFLKIGAVLFGSGYVLLAFLRADFVERLHWLTPNQLLDAVAVGQFTPGPVFTTATFIGYVLAGPLGAVAATIGIFLPAFFFVAVSGPFIPRLRASKVAGGFLDGLNVASLALMGVAAWEFGAAALRNGYSAAIFAMSLFLLLKYKVNSAWLVLGGAAIGFVAYLHLRV
jgi:chromate transporter